MTSVVVIFIDVLRRFCVMTSVVVIFIDVLRRFCVMTSVVVIFIIYRCVTEWAMLTDQLILGISQNN